MLPFATVDEIRRLLEEGEMSQRKIARKLRVSRGTVGAIASGRRGIHGRESDEEVPTVGLLNRPPERCGGCGATVYKPCILCGTRQFQERHKLLELLKAMPTSSARRVA